MCPSHLNLLPHRQIHPLLPRYRNPLAAIAFHDITSITRFIELLGHDPAHRRFIDRQPIYHTPALHTAWEAAARYNLRQELGRLAAPS